MHRVTSISVIVPVLNEAESIESLVDQVEAVLQRMDLGFWEVIVVDDGSTDGTAEQLQKFSLDRKNLNILVFQRNFGKAHALSAGFQYARGEVIVTLDGDLQDDPEDIPRLVEHLYQGYDLVSGWKKNRRDPLEKRLASCVFNFLLAVVTGVKLHDANCGLKVMRAWCVHDLVLHGNMHRFLATLTAQRGAKIAEIAINHRERSYGKSKYGLKRYIHGFFDLLTVFFLTRFQQHPLYFFGLIAVPLILLGVVVGLYLLGSHILFLLEASWGVQLVSRPLLIICISLFGFGLQILLTGLLCEFVLRGRSIRRGYWIKHRIQQGEITEGPRCNESDPGKDVLQDMHVESSKTVIPTRSSRE